MRQIYFDEVLIEHLNKNQDGLIVTPKKVIQPLSLLEGQTKEITDEIKFFYHNLKKKSWRKIIKSYQDFRIKNGPEQAAMLSNLLLKARQNLHRDGSISFGLIQNGNLKIPILSQNMAKIYNSYVDESIKIYNAVDKSYFVPSSFRYDVNDFDCSSLEKILDKNKYRIDKYGDIRSSNIKLKSKDKLHSVAISYTLHSDEPAITVKYMAFGFKIGDKRDKLDICYKVNFLTKRGEPLHIEANLEIQEKIHSNLLLELKLLSQRIRGITDTQIKVDRKTGKTFFSYKQDNEQKREDWPNYIKEMTNYDLLTKKPLLLGGGIFDYAVKLGIENQNKLLEIRDSFKKNI